MAEGRSIRKLPAGKLQSLTQMFEEKDAQASGANIYGVTVSKPATDRVRSLSTTAQPRLASNTSTVSARRQWMSPVTSPTPDRRSKLKDNSRTSGILRQRSLSEKEEWSAGADRKSGASGASTALTKRVTAYTSSCVGTGREGQREDSPIKRFSEPRTFKDDSPLNSRCTPERQRAMSEASAISKLRPNEAKVQDRLKLFEEKSSPQTKPALGVLGQSMSSVSNGQRLSKLSEQTKETNGKVDGVLGSGRNHETLRSEHNHSNNHGSSVSSKHDSKTDDHLNLPPKPPRTFAHDEYLQTKLLSADSQSVQNVKGKQSDVYNVKARVSLLNSGKGDKEEVNLRTKDSYSHLGQNQNSAQTVKEKSPSRLFPSRLRPISEATALHKHTRQSPERSLDNDDSDSDGPVVISLKHGKRLDSPVRTQGARRNPRDELPEPPKSVSDLQQFALRKSFSSEYLNKGSNSSLVDIEEEHALKSSIRRSSNIEGGKGDNYEALVDHEGYALPHKFQRIQEEQRKKGGSGDNAGVHKRALGPSVSQRYGSPVVATPTPVKDQDVEKVPRKKLNLVRQKINQAYEDLHRVFETPRASLTDDNEDVDSVDQTQNTDDAGDTDSTVDAKEIKRRVTYCSKVRLKTTESIKKSKEFLDKVYPQLFEYALIVGLNMKTADPGYDPYIIHKFPPMVNIDASVPKFCFPDAEEFRPGSMTTPSESYSFVLTNIDGARLYGYCRRIQPRDVSLPEVICIVSPVDAFNMYNKLLSEIEKQRFKSRDQAQELIAASFGRPMPSPGKVCHIRSMAKDGQMETLLMDRPLDQRLANVNYECLLSYLGTDKLIQVFSSILMERRLILCSHHLSVLTQTIHALVALLYPFQWQHVYIPLLPPDMLDVCAAPMPFIIGILLSHLDRVTDLELEDVIIVDLDKKQVLSSVGDESTLLPKKVQKALKTAINMCKIDSDTLNSQWLMVSEAFLRLFLETMGHFPQHITTQQDGQKAFSREQFIAGVSSKSIRQFLEWFTETQMFEVFITLQLEAQHWHSLDLFMKRLGELQSKRQADGSQSKGIGRRVRNIGKAIKTKLK